jgi:hypothetical protein
MSLNGVDTFFLFCQGRSGGSSLQEAINAGINKENQALGEPFSNEGYRDRILRSDSFEGEIRNVLKELAQDYSGIKVNVGNLLHYDLPRVRKAGNSQNLSKVLFDFFNHVIVNGRKNLLKSIISERIAVVLDHWHVDSTEERKKLVESAETWEEDMEAVKEHLERRSDSWNRAINFIESSEIETLRVDYEDFYVDTDLQMRLEKVKSIVKWIGYDFDPEHLGAIKHLLSKRRKVSNKDLYLLIENIEEINSRFGPEYGYLF